MIGARAATERSLGEPRSGRNGVRFLAAFLGPAWTAAAGKWLPFVGLLALELLGITLIATGWFGRFGEESTTALFWGLFVFFGARILVGVTADLHYPFISRAFLVRGIVGFVVWSVCFAVLFYRFLATDPSRFLVGFPAPEGLSTFAAMLIDTGVDWMKENWVGFFDLLTAGLRSLLGGIEAAFTMTPWPVLFLLAIACAWAISGGRAAAFTAASLAYLGLFGYWEKSMSTLALVAASVILCIAFGIPLGIIAAKSSRARSLIYPVLDVMQTLPTFVYLIPAVAFFSIGQPPGVIATVIFALPPMARLTALGILQVPHDVREAADAFGGTPLQILKRIELPLAASSIRLGINQSIMMSLSMVVVSAMIGAGGLGLDVIRSLQHLKTGEGFLAGCAIVLCAMTLDRAMRGKGNSRQVPQ